MHAPELVAERMAVLLSIVLERVLSASMLHAGMYHSGGPPAASSKAVECQHDIEILFSVRLDKIKVRLDFSESMTIERMAGVQSRDADCETDMELC